MGGKKEREKNGTSERRNNVHQENICNQVLIKLNEEKNK